MITEFPPKGGISDCDHSPVNSSPMDITKAWVVGSCRRDFQLVPRCQ